MGSVAVGEFPDLGDAFLTAFAHDVGGAEFAAEVRAGRVAAHEDDARRAHELGGENR